MFFFWPKKNKNKARIFADGETNFGFLSRYDRSLEEAASAVPGSAISSGRLLGLSITPWAFRIGFFLSIFCLILLAGRAFQLQIINGHGYRQQAEENRFQILTMPAERGVIFDRTGIVLTENAPAFTLTMMISELSEDKTQREKVFNRVAELTGLQPADFDLFLQEYAAVPTEEIIVEKSLSYERALLFMVEEENLPGFSVRLATKRQYESSAVSLSHVLGYTGKINVEEFAELENSGYRRTDEIGKTGIEASWETALRGQPGRRLVEVDASGNETAIFSEEAAVKGSAVTLSIDLELQKVVEQYLSEAAKKINRSRASAVVMNPNNGEVLALVSLPSYDSNLFSGGIDKESYVALSENPNQPLFPRATAGEFPSGSIFKPYVAAAALTEGIITPTTSFLSTGGLTIGQWFFPDWKAGGHGITNVRKALAESVNTFFYTIGGGYDSFTGLGVEKITDYARIFGFGQKTGIDLTGEADGFLPSKIWKETTKGERWYVGDTYHLAIGQGDLLVTPIQMAAALSVLANGGTKYTPHLVMEVDDQPVYLPNETLSIPLKEAIEVVREGMRQAVTSGSAIRLNSLPITSAGKTGTAQIGGTEETHAWFTGFAPYDNPEIAVVILIEEGGEGSSTAVPVAENIFRWWYNNRSIK
ncbi:MAG: penicillin-binding protein 2 [Patescibacteria group bacterium]